MPSIVDDSLADELVMVEQRRGAIPDEEVDRRVRERAPQILEQRGRQHDVAEASQLDYEDLTRMRDAGRLHSGLRHSLAYCTKA